MFDLDVWQVMGSLAAISFTVGFAGQVRVTLQTKNVGGLSLLQWLMFLSASVIFTAYYSHLEQWAMVIISMFGTLCCAAMAISILKYRQHS